MNSTLRMALPKDVQSLSEISSATFALACSPNTPPADLAAYIRSELSPERFLEHMACKTKSFFVAEVAGRGIGYIMLCRETLPSMVVARNPLELRRIYVLPNFHGSGIADMLMAAALQQAVAGNHDVVWLGVSKHNARAIAFYHKTRILGNGRTRLCRWNRHTRGFRHGQFHRSRP